MAEQLPIVGHQFSADLGETWTDCDEAFATQAAQYGGAATRALTPHAPAQSALDELRREVEALRADAKRLQHLIDNAHNSSDGGDGIVLVVPDSGAGWADRVRAAIDTARASTDEGRDAPR